MMKLALMRTATAKEDPCSAKINASQISSNRHISTSTVQKRLHESGLHGRIAAKKPLLKDTNNTKRLAWSKKHEQWTLDQWKCVLWADKPKLDIFGSNCRVFVRGVIVWGCFTGDTVCDKFSIQGKLNQHGYHSILQ